MQTAPRIYNLFPLLAGPVTKWKDHLPRIADMGFNWIYINPFHYPGFSGSLYAIKDFKRLHPRLQGTSKKDQASLIEGFCQAAEKYDIMVMLDLVINHTAKDALLVDEHPNWYMRESDGSVHSPRTVDPLNADNITVWGDLGEIDYEHSGAKEEMLKYWQDLVDYYIAMGCRGFRCDAAYQVPNDVWRPLIETARKKAPECFFAAETLGCRVDQTMALKGAGFDYLFNSSKWWDFHQNWVLDQYEMFRQVGPTIAFPESHDTDRLINELGTREPAEVERQYKFWYMFSSIFSSGVMTTMGFEYGFDKRLHVVHTQANEWAEQYDRRLIDITEFIASVNQMKAETPTLNVEGHQRLVYGHDGPVVSLVRFDAPDAHNAKAATVSIINPDIWQAHTMNGGLVTNGDPGRLAPFKEITPGDESETLEGGRDIKVDRRSMRIFNSG